MLFPDFTDLYHLRADGWRALGDVGQAIASMQQALRLGPASEEYPSMTGIGTYLTLSSLMSGDTRIVFGETSEDQPQF
ncbi:hypothetical protein [Paenibacillus medicaginis]|uniref:Tetratricopeptide repeat protein n=1 Tax=Paenibacillus medicaginis TaxID=1470560 RepID=A0ABV5C902_9BACL